MIGKDGEHIRSLAGIAGMTLESIKGIESIAGAHNNA